MADGGGGIILPPLPNKPNYNSSPENSLLPGVNQHLVESVVNQLPEIADVLRRVQTSRASFTDILLRTSLSDVERLPPIHPSIASSRGDQTTRYITFVTAPPIERRPPGKRPKHTPRKPLGEEECYRCQLHTDHAECEKHKYLRIGGGFRHSYWYIRGILDVIEEEQRLAAEEALRKYQEEQERLEEERRRREQPKRRVKTYVRTKSGRRIKKYHYFTEDEYKEFKKDDETARKMLGLGENEELMDWSASRGVYVQSDTGDFIKARKRKGEDGVPYLDYGQFDDTEKGKHHRRRRDRSYSSDSGGSRGSRDGHRRRRRHRRRHGSSDSDSDRSYDDRGGSRDRRRRHRRRHRSYSSDDSGTDLGSADGGGRRRRRHRRSRRRSMSGSSADSYDSRDRRRRRRHRRRSYSDSDSDRSRSRRRGRRHRRRHRDSSYSDYSDDGGDSDGGRRRGGGRRRRRRRSYSDDSYSGDDDDRRRRRRSGRRHRRRRHRDSYSDDSYDSRGSMGDEDGGGRRRHRRRRRRRSYDSYDSESDVSGDDGSGRGRRRGGRKGKGGRRRRRHYSDSYSSYSDSDGDGGGGRGRGRRGRRRRRSYYSDEEDDYDSDGSRRHSRRRGKGGRRRRGRRRHSSSDDGSYSGSDGDSSRRRRRRRRRRRHDSSYSDSYSSSSSSAGIASIRSSEISDASDPSSVHSSDISSISGDFSESEKRRLKAEKKKKIFEQKKQKKKEEKVEKIREQIEVKREKKRQEKQEKRERRERKKEKRRERERRRRRYSSSSSSESRTVSPVRSDEVSSVHSSQVSSVSGDFSEGEKRRRKEEKKKKLKEQKKEIKQKEKEEVRKQERRDRHERRRERRRRTSYMSTVSAASPVSSVHSSEISDVSGDYSEGERERLKQEKKRKKKEEKQVSKQLKKEKERRDERRRERKGRRRGSDEYSSDDSYARGKQDFYDIPGEKGRSMVKYGKGSRRGLTSPIEKEGMDKRKKKGRRRQGDGADDSDDDDVQVEIITSDGKKVKMKKSVLKQLQREGKLDASGAMKHKIRVKKDGTLARDSDSDAESITLDTSTVTKLKKQAGAFDLMDVSQKWTGFAPTPEPPKTPTDGGRIKLKGVRKVQAAFRKDQGRLQTQLQKVLESAKELKDEETENTLDERDSSINFIAHFRLVEEVKVDPFARAFVIEDGNADLILDVSELKTALEGIPSTQDVKDKQIDYALKVLDIDDHSKISFKMFAVVAAVLERICNMDPYDQSLIDKTDLMDIERKMALYKAMFYCNVNSDRSPNYITAESLRIELIAGGLNRAQEEYIMSKMKPNEYREINFIDYMAYIPLFMSMHENIVGNPLDRSYKYTEKREELQRDLVPLGLPMRREFLHLPKNIFPTGGVSAKVREGAVSSRGFVESGELIGKQVSKLPKIGSRPSSRKKSRMFLSLD